MKELHHSPCHCGSGKGFSQCCEPLLLNKQQAETAETLMRARYSAYVMQNEAYLLRTWHKSTRPKELNFSEGRKPRWNPLKVISTSAGKQGDKKGTVEFSTGYWEGGTVTPLHETSRFRWENHRWLYLDGSLQSSISEAKVGRNDLCPCGSGKKHKKCCL